MPALSITVEPLGGVGVYQMKMRILRLVNELPALFFELDEEHCEAVQLVRDLAERPAAVRDGSYAERLDAPLELIVIKFGSQIGRLIRREHAPMLEMRMSHEGLIGATLRTIDTARLSLSSTGS